MMAFARLLEHRPDEDDFKPVRPTLRTSRPTSWSGERRPLSSKSIETNQLRKKRRRRLATDGEVLEKGNAGGSQHWRRLTCKAMVSWSQLLRHRSDDEDFKKENINFRPAFGSLKSQQPSQDKHLTRHGNKRQPRSEKDILSSSRKHKQGPPRLKLIRRLKELGEDEADIEALFDQWFLNRKEDLRPRRGQCACGQQRLRYHFHILNRLTGGRTRVGSSCISRFRRRFEKTSPIADKNEGIGTPFAIGPDVGTGNGQGCDDFKTPHSPPGNSNTNAFDKTPHKGRSTNTLSRKDKTWIRLF
ncbi:uncharacterized protein LOC119731532 [Patiria miniata]|uniref:Uncharacterized protein n=1 Tax=Patiria miniata TaxID=46514 RepID=A0A914AA41_PATMI|nr:uncharacterized protein LOC119731532 [Patiria miniata]